MKTFGDKFLARRARWSAMSTNFDVRSKLLYSLFEIAADYVLIQFY